MTDAQRSRKRQVSRRSFLQGIGIGSTTLLLAACPAPAGSGGEAGSAAPAAEDIELDFFAWGDASDIPAWESLKNTYAEQNPNVTVKPSISGTGVDYYTKLQTTFAGGVVPEVASFQGWEWQPFSDAGLLAPIDAYVERDNFTGPYPEGVDSIEFSTRRDGSRYLIPLQSGVMVMFYAKNAFDEAGVAYPTDDWTFDDFVSNCRATHQHRRRFQDVRLSGQRQLCPRHPLDPRHRRPGVRRIGGPPHSHVRPAGDYRNSAAGCPGLHVQPWPSLRHRPIWKAAPTRSTPATRR